MSARRVKNTKTLCDASLENLLEDLCDASLENLLEGLCNASGRSRVYLLMLMLAYC
jgi:hypothetical protein